MTQRFYGSSAHADVLLLDEPDNFLDIPGKRWLEEKMNASLRTILYVSHDRALLANTSSRVVTLEAGGAWVHPESYLTYETARSALLGRIEDERKQFRNEKERLNTILKEYKRKSAYNEKFATKVNSMEKRIERFERDMAPRERAKEQKIKMDLGGGRTGKIVFKAKDFSIPGLIDALTRGSGSWGPGSIRGSSRRRMIAATSSPFPSSASSAARV